MSWRETAVGENKGPRKSWEKLIKESLLKAQHDAWDANLWQTCEFNVHEEPSAMINEKHTLATKILTEEEDKY